MKLIQLELQKNNLSVFKIASICIFFFGMGIAFFLAFLPTINAIFLPHELQNIIGTTIQKMFSDEVTFCLFISILFSLCFSILASIMHGRITIEEYLGKKATLLFAYPYSRSKILCAKITLVSVFIFVSFMICTLITIVILGFLSNIFHILPFLFKAITFPKILFMITLCGAFTCLVGLICMRIGFWKKSIVAPIVTACILVSPFTNLLQIMGTNVILLMMIFVVLLFASSIFIIVNLSKRVNVLEIS